MDDDRPPWRPWRDEVGDPIEPGLVGAGELRIDLAMSQLLGIAYLRHILRGEPIASTPVEELVARLAPVVTAHLNDT